MTIIMIRFFILLFAASSLTALGQVTYPYNPDGNADSAIGVSDIQDLLTVYGNPFSPSEIMVGDSSLTFWVEHVSQMLEEQQITIDSLAHLSLNLALGPTEHFKFHELDWTLQLNNGNQYLSTVQFNQDGFVRLNGGQYDLTFIIVDDTVAQSLFANAQLAENNFIDSYWRSNYTQATIPVNSNEKIILFGNSGVLEEGTGTGEMNLYWTPVHTTDENDSDTSNQDSEDEQAAWQCGELLAFHGDDYRTVEVGNQCWIAENVRYLPEVSPPAVGSENDGLPHAYVYGYRGTSITDAKEHEAYRKFGVLYNYLAVETWGLCPSGWHVSTDSDWLMLENMLGLPDSLNATLDEDREFAFRQILDEFEWRGNNFTGVSIGPSGARRSYAVDDDPAGTFGYGNSEFGSAYFWNDQSAGETQLRRFISFVRVQKGFRSIHQGYSVRCVQDAE